MMTHRYTWQAVAIPVGADRDFAVLEISADEVDVNAVGVTTFYAHDGDGQREKVLASFKASDLKSLAIQSAVDGYVSAYNVLARHTPNRGRTKAAGGTAS